MPTAGQLAHLRRLPVSHLKIDESCLLRMRRDQNGAPMD